MKFLIHFELADGSENSIEVSGNTLEEIRIKAEAEVFKRGGTNSWSEEIS